MTCSANDLVGFIAIIKPIVFSLTIRRIMFSLMPPHLKYPFKASIQHPKIPRSKLFSEQYRVGLLGSRYSFC
ncbi:hypothetical protein Lpar_1050 [Legionella parisiensis]|uniref:Uncharacterized protein n=1 Tax=Legionella parisiensis TaxID=45071 RepID=A0A1E5JKX0_9GAMM|nr:hypothetical protein Lpar_1050 [Legionella parisiensis]OEH45152.1 hypothetical protein lpari_03922 [Legionella parisiensis]STX77848.1 Uncharacterised protein [Legionella parisiensis]